MLGAALLSLTTHLHPPKQKHVPKTSLSVGQEDTSEPPSSKALLTAPL